MSKDKYLSIFSRQMETCLFILFEYFICFSGVRLQFLTVSLAVQLRLVESFQPGSIPCSIVISATVLFDGLSRIKVIFISIDRLIAVKFPYAYKCSKI